MRRTKYIVLAPLKYSKDAIIRHVNCQREESMNNLQISHRPRITIAAPSITMLYSNVQASPRPSLLSIIASGLESVESQTLSSKSR